ncbi:MAG: PKD domain-containing protein [bacterium]
MKKFLFLLLPFIISPFFLFEEVKADVGDNVSGFAWSENIGWISFNNTTGGGAVSYGVNVDETGLLSGFAWSENIGWISFDVPDLAGCPDAPVLCEARLDFGTGLVSGWAKVLSDSSWIHLRGAGYGVAWNSGTEEMDGFAWSESFGWISFNCNNEGACASSDYKVIAQLDSVLPDTTPPTSVIYRRDGSGWIKDDGGSWHKSDFIRRSDDFDEGGSGLDKCYYYVYDNVAGVDTTGPIERTCSTIGEDIDITVGPGFNCPSQGKDACALYVYAIDNAGNESKSYGAATYHIDWTYPVVGETSPLTADQGIAKNFSASVSDNVELNYCWLYVDGSFEDSMTLSPLPCQDGAVCTVSKNYAFTSGGPHTMYAECADWMYYIGSSCTECDGDWCPCPGGDCYCYGNITSGDSVDVAVSANTDPEITVDPSYTAAPCLFPTTQSDCVVSFEVTATDEDGDPLTYEWDFGDGGVSDLEDPDYQYTAAGVYDVTVTVSDGRGGTDSKTILGLQVADPALSVALTALPVKGVIKDDYSGLKELIDLTAAVSGTMTGTINYKFDCEDDGTWELEVFNTTNNPYTAVDLCDYNTLGAHTAKVLIERGDSCGLTECTNGETCCQIRRIDILVEENEPPVCQISVPGGAAVNQWIDIGVGGSSDPEGAIAEVRFCSDKDPANPNGFCDESWTQEYGWNTPSGDWQDAVSKTIKWRFAEPGEYEVWAEVKDDTSQIDSCYANITITECVPGETKICVSPQGCNHTQICQSDATWSVCPSDICSPGLTQACGTDGTQTCADVCVWGVCVEPKDCVGLPPSCPLCQHAECVSGSWVCQFDPAGTVCGDCSQCNGAGFCQGCPEICVSSLCTTCSAEYNGGCGYGYCGSLEIPVWEYSGGACSYDCQYELTCPGDGETSCLRNYPEVYLSPSFQQGTAGDTLTYDVFVDNNDSAICGPSIFSLTKGCPAGWSCSLGSSSLNVDFGESGSTNLTVISPSSSPLPAAGNHDVLVTATNNAVPTYSRTGYAVYQISNYSPTASISCDNSNCSPGSSCGAQWTAYRAVADPIPCIFTLVNDSSDPDGIGDIKNSTWTITGPTSETSYCLFDPVCDWSLPSNYAQGSYTAQLEVEDQTGKIDTSPAVSFYVREEVFADFVCSLSGVAGPWQDCDTLKVPEDVIVYFNGSISSPSETAVSISSWSWTFKDGTPSVGSGQYPSPASFEIIDAGSGEVTLTVVDSLGRSDEATYRVQVSRPLPEWKETPPFPF